MRYELSNYEWTAIKPMLPNKPRRSADLEHPWVRLALGDLTAALPGLGPCGRSNMRIKGWLGRDDQTTKVKGMFVRPEQISEIGKRHLELERLRLVVSRDGETDAMTLRADAAPSEALRGDSPQRCARSQNFRAASIWLSREACRKTARSSPTSAKQSRRIGGA